MLRSAALLRSDVRCRSCSCMNIHTLSKQNNCRTVSGGLRDGAAVRMARALCPNVSSDPQNRKNHRSPEKTATFPPKQTAPGPNPTGQTANAKPQQKRRTKSKTLKKYSAGYSKIGTACAFLYKIRQNSMGRNYFILPQAARDVNRSMQIMNKIRIFCE